MRLSKDFRETIRKRAERQPAFRRALVQEAIEQIRAGDRETGGKLIQYLLDLKLSEDEQKAFVEALMNPPEPNEKLREAYERYRRFMNGRKV